jgi:hypothetical protein
VRAGHSVVLTHLVLVTVQYDAWDGTQLDFES